MDKEPCQHINAHLAGGRSKSPYRTRMLSIDSFHDLTKEPELSREEKASSFRRFLLKYGLSKEEREFLVCKFAYDYTYAQLAAEFHFVSLMTTWRFTKHLVNKVKSKILLERQNAKKRA